MSRNVNKEKYVEAGFESSPSKEKTAYVGKDG